MQSGQKLAIVTQDPANYGGVLRLAEYVYRRALAVGIEPTLVHYARHSEHPELNASAMNLLRGELNLWPQSKRYEFQGMRAIAIGACLPEWEPNRIRANRIWRKVLSGFDGFILVTGSAHTGLPLVQCKKPFVAWVSSTVESDRRERLKKERSVLSWLERRGLRSVKTSEFFVLDGASRVLAVSADAARDLHGVAEKIRIELAPFPIDTNRFAPASVKTNDPPARFLFVGRANDPRKRIGLFFEACERVHALDSTLDFVATVISRIAPPEQPRGFHLDYRSHVSEEELVELYSGSTALVLTSEQEGLGIAAMEAMACGLPVISTRCGGPEMFIEDTGTGFIVEGTVELIAQRMSALARDSAMHRRMGEASRQKIVTAFSESVWNPFFDMLIQNLP